jgi:hypothetical protein
MVRAKNSKNREAEPLPLHPELVRELKSHQPSGTEDADLVLTGRMLPGMWKMKSDLRRAGIEYIRDGRVADFHALRHTLATNLGLSGAPPRLAMSMMRHSDMKLTMKNYTDAKVLPLVNLLSGLPSFLTTEKEEALDDDTQIGTLATGAEGQLEAQAGPEAEIRREINPLL